MNPGKIRDGSPDIVPPCGWDDADGDIDGQLPPFSPVRPARLNSPG